MLCRDFSSLFLKGWAENINVDPGFLSKLMALSQALNLALEWNHHSIITEQDCKELYQAFSERMKFVSFSLIPHEWDWKLLTTILLGCLSIK